MGSSGINRRYMGIQTRPQMGLQMEIQIRLEVPVLRWLEIQMGLQIHLLRTLENQKRRWLEIQMGLQMGLQMEIQIRLQKPVLRWLEVQVENHLGLQECLENQDHWLHYQVRLEIHLEAHQVPQRLQKKRQQVLPWPQVLLITVITRTPIYSIAFEFITLTDSN